VCVEKLVLRDHPSQVRVVYEEDLDLQAVVIVSCVSLVLVNACTNPYEWSCAMASETNTHLVFKSCVDVSKWCLFGVWVRGLGHVLTHVVAVTGFKMLLRPFTVQLSSIHQHHSTRPLYPVGFRTAF
jgi:hypothetical protein